MRRLDFILITLIIITIILSINTIGGTLFLEDKDNGLNGSYAYAYVSGYPDTEYPYNVYNVHHDYDSYVPPFGYDEIDMYPAEGGSVSYAYTDVKVYVWTGNSNWELGAHAHAQISP